MILAIDTATRWTCLALHDGTAVIAELGWRSVNNQTSELAPTLDDMLTRASVTAVDLKAIAVAIGPGSYTGLRIGLALAKGLALSYQIPLIGVPTLDIIAASIPPQNEPLVLAVEAGRTRVCVATYKWQGRKGWQAIAPPIIESWENVLPTMSGTLTFGGELSLQGADLIRRHNRSARILLPVYTLRRAGFLAEIGWAKLRKGETANPAELAPIYLKDPAGN